MGTPTIPSDQHIVDEYFRLMSTPGFQQVGWVFGMVAAYGKPPEDFCDVQWKDGVKILLKDRKRSIVPVHPQWTILFRLKETQPKTLRVSCEKFKKGIKEGYVNIDVPHLLEAYKQRKYFYSVN